MSDSDGHVSDPSDSSSGDYATVEEVAAELAQLSPAALDKIEAQARVLVRGTDIGPGDLVNTVVERLLTRDGDHGRHWHRKETLASCIYRTMKSIVRDHWRRQQIAMTAVGASAAWLQEVPDPEAQLIARQVLQAVLTSLGDQDVTSAIAIAVASGRTPAEVRRRFGLTEAGYDSALKRIRRRILKLKASGGRE
jgi:DNA-directed RNA polymerase specialized sigma24 family protein